MGLVVADMVGAGVLTTSGFMALELPPSYILLGWAVGGLIALCGALAYAELARRIPRSGGEYRYLSTLVHPSVGYLAGWTSLLVGFSVPVALAALGAGAFAQTVVPGVDVRWVAAALIAVVTLVYAVDLGASRWAQDGLAAVKIILLAAFIGIGLFAGAHHLPSAPPQSAGSSAADAGFPTTAFFTSLIFITFCYTGWNAATYASDRFENPRRDVPRSMVVGCLLVMGIYLLVNWILVANLTQADMVHWIKGDTDRITLAHLVMHKLVGGVGAKIMSVVVIVALASAISAMTMIGPHVYSEMASDGFLPRTLASSEGRPPAGSVLLQGGLSMFLVFSSGFRELLNNVGSILAVVSALTVLSLFRTLREGVTEGPKGLALVGALVYAAMSGWMVYYAMGASRVVSVGGLVAPSLALWMTGIVVISMSGYFITRSLQRRAPAGGLVEPVDAAASGTPRGG